MWCSLCRTDVAVKTTGHAGGLLCSRCGHDLLSAAKPTDAIRHAREILERWNSSDLFERISRTESLDALHTQRDAAKKSDAPKKSLSADLMGSAAPKQEPREVVQEVAQLETETPEKLSATSPNAVAGSAASPSGAVEALEPAIEQEHPKSRPATVIPTAEKSARIVNLSELTHTDILSVRTVANSRVTGQGITHELQRVMDLARAQNADPMSIPEDDTSDATAERVTDAPAEADATNPIDPQQSSKPALIEVAGSYPDSPQSPQIPAEAANASEPASAAVPKMILRSPMRRPLLHRRFQLERPATTSSTGSENVNRKLRVDQPGGNNDLPETATVQQDAPVSSSVAPETKIVSNSPGHGSRIRIDEPESVNTVTETDGRRGRTQTLPKQRYIDDAHDSAMRGPHFEITPPRRSNLTSVTGQLLAYLGVLGLTIGTAMVIYGHFGGYSEYTPTGWLVTTVAQMLLFLGVINLVSGGIEQNNDEVSRRISTLGEQLLRIEQVTADAMKGPKLSPHLYENPNADDDETARETAGVNRE